MESEILILDAKDTYSRTYRMRLSSPSARTISTSFPADAVERAAQRRGMSVEKFVEEFYVEFLYNGIEGGFFRFVSIEGKKRRKLDG